MWEIVVAWQAPFELEGSNGIANTCRGWRAELLQYGANNMKRKAF